jgi:hypothetical protein
MFRPPTAAIELPEHYSWAELMRRMFSVDVLECVACGSRIRIVRQFILPRQSEKVSIVLAYHPRPTDCAGITHP